MRNIEQITEIVRRVLAEDFDKIQIADVKVREDRDSDGEEILRVFVVFEGKPKDSDLRKLSGAVRLVRPKLTEVGETAFPLFSFISKSDAGDRVRGAA